MSSRRHNSSQRYASRMCDAFAALGVVTIANVQHILPFRVIFSEQSCKTSNTYSVSVNHSFSYLWVNNSVEAYQFRESNFMATIGLIGGDYRAVRLLLVTTPRAARGEHQARRKRTARSQAHHFSPRSIYTCPVSNRCFQSLIVAFSIRSKSFKGLPIFVFVNVVFYFKFVVIVLLCLIKYF